MNTVLFAFLFKTFRPHPCQFFCLKAQTPAASSSVVFFFKNKLFVSMLQFFTCILYTYYILCIYYVYVSSKRVSARACMRKKVSDMQKKKLYKKNSTERFSYFIFSVFQAIFFIPKYVQFLTPETPGLDYCCESIFLLISPTGRFLRARPEMLVVVLGIPYFKRVKYDLR